MVVKCEEVWQEVSNYVDGDVGPELRAAMDDHFRQCQRCAAVLEGTRNIVQLYGDERMMRTPFGFSWRLRGKLAQNLPGRRGTAFGWLVAAAAIGLIVGSFTVASSAGQRRASLRSEHAQPGESIPNNLIVLVAAHSKVFHVSGCPFIHDKEGGIRSMQAIEAMREGYVPCVRCLRQYVSLAAAMVIGKHAMIVA